MTKEYLHPVLFKHYPELEERIAWVQLGSFPTPLQQLKHLGYDNLWIKRDDMTSPIYGGNKVRKLEFTLADAKKKKKKHVVTVGGIGTNHGLATSIFTSRLGMGCTLILFRQPVTNNVKQNLLLFYKYNAEMVYKNSLPGMLISYLFTQKLKNPFSYYLFAGGSSIHGIIGFVNAAFELKSQVEEGLMPEPACIFIPVGSGGSIAGLALGVTLAGLNTRIIGIRVTASHFGPVQLCTEDTIQRSMKAAYKFLRKKCSDIPGIDPAAPQLLGDYFGGAYGLPTEECRNAYHSVREKENIALDPCYTAKAFAAVMDYCGSHSNGSKPVLFWNTYNSVDLSSRAASVNYRELPAKLQKFFEQEEIVI